MSESLDVTIESIAAGGDGVGRHNGRVVFVPRTAPGDRVRVHAIAKGRLMRGSILQILEPSPARVTPECDHYERDRCGGCQLQHMSYQAQLDAKSGIIRDSLKRIGGRDINRPSVEASDALWRYRRKLTLALRHHSGSIVFGLHPFDAPDTVFDLSDCRITDEGVQKIWAHIRRNATLLPLGPELRASVLRLEHGYSLVVEGAKTWTTHAELFDAVPELTQLWWTPHGSARQLLHSRGEGAGASFAQVNSAMANKLVQHVLSLSASESPKTAIDAYSGTGDIAVGLAGQGARVTAIEIDADASRVCASRLPAGSRAIAASVESALAGALPADVVVLNPPRAGLSARTCELLHAARSTLRAVIYVSCDPGTLARDLKRLASYELKSVRGFDMFPHTAHVETVCHLVPAA